MIGHPQSQLCQVMVEERRPQLERVRHRGDIGLVEEVVREIRLDVDELEACGTVRTRKLRQRGQPRIIELVSSDDSVRGVDEIRTEGGSNG